jgi:hypothetical protein
MQFGGDETPPGPAVYVDSLTFGPRLYEPAGTRWSDRTVLEVVLDGLPPSEREAVRRRNGLAANGPWEEVYVVSSENIEADITDFEWCLKTLVTMEDPGEEEHGRVHRVPRVTYIRDMISECLEPLYHHVPEVFDFRRMTFYDSDERAFLKERITCLLAALYACQTLSMNSVELRAYLDSERKSACQIERTQVFVEMVDRYKKEFVSVCGGGMNPLRTMGGFERL